MNVSPFSCPIFLGRPRARGRCSQSERMLYGRDLCCSGGTGKAEAAKLPGAGIRPSRAQENEGQKKTLPSRKIGIDGRVNLTTHQGQAFAPGGAIRWRITAKAGGTTVWKDHPGISRAAASRSAGLQERARFRCSSIRSRGLGRCAPRISALSKPPLRLSTYF